MFTLYFIVHLTFHRLLSVSVFTLYFIVCCFCVHLIFHCVCRFRFLSSPYISSFALGFCIPFLFCSCALPYYSNVVVFLHVSVLYLKICCFYSICAVPYIPLSLLYIYVLYLIFRYHCYIFMCCTLYSVIIALYFCVVLCISFFWLYISVPWAVQARLLTPLTFARHRLSPLAAFTSDAYFFQR